MEIKNLSTANWHEKYNLLVEYIPDIYNASGPIFFTWLKVRPLSESIKHQHHELEYLTIIKGIGEIHAQNEIHALEQGTFITLAPFEKHVVKNISSSEDLLILSVVIDDVTKLPQQQVPGVQSFPFKQYLIISTPPTPNGDLHLGHLSGPYLKADILRRFLIANGLMAYHLTGQDDHQSYTAHKGKQLEWTAEKTADYFGNEIELTLKASDIDLAYFSKPRLCSNYIDDVQANIKRLWDNGYIIIKDAPSLICTLCDQYLYEVYVRGLCPHCKIETGGNFCEACGKINDCADLIDPVCSSCKTAPTITNVRRAYFNLASFTDKLIEYHGCTHMQTWLREYCKIILETDTGLPDVPLSHPSTWGINCPIPLLENQIISVWFEMGLGHFASARGFVEEKRPHGVSSGLVFWENQDATVINSFGFDNSFFNCFLFPATCFALSPQLKPPSAFYSNQFYCLENLKFSTSRNHLIWAKDFLKKHSSDMMRMFLCLTSPEETKTSFSQSEFDTFVYNLNNSLENHIAIIHAAIKNYFSGKAPATGLWEDTHVEFYSKLVAYIHNIHLSYCPNSFSLRAVATSLYELLQDCLEFSEQEISQKQNYRTDEYRTSLALGLLSLKVFAICAYPIMPRTANSLWGSLGYKELLRWEMPPTWIPYKQTINFNDDIIND